MIKFLDEYRDVDLSLKLAENIRKISKKRFNIMEVCGGHTMAIRKNGIHKLVGENIRLISGPGCPVCVTAMEDIDKVIALSKIENAVICTFGDLFYVPGTASSLAQAKAEGEDIRIVYSVYDALNYAKQQRDKKVIFISIGFETTAPTAAAAVMQARAEKISNFYILALNKTMPNALRVVLQDKDSVIDALLCPGHVSTITGIDIYRFIVDELGVSCCVSGFEPLDMLAAIYTLTDAYENGKASLTNTYKRVVRDEGNKKAQNIMYEVFKPHDAPWRGIGIIAGSGLKLKNIYKEFDAEENFNIDIPESKENYACICGDILRGAKQPTDCRLFGGACIPLNPKGACMVSNEGTCAAWYKYGS